MISPYRSTAGAVLAAGLLTRIVSFIGVGLLMLIGFVAPLPATDRNPANQ